MRVQSIAVADSRSLRHAALRPHQPPEAVVWMEPPGAVAYAAFEDGLQEPIAVGLVGRDGGSDGGPDRGADVGAGGGADRGPDVWRVRGMATAAQARGRGAGSAVLNALIDHARANGAVLIWCNARIAARTLYERAGFVVVSDEFEIKGIGPHYRMELSLS